LGYSIQYAQIDSPEAVITELSVTDTVDMQTRRTISMPISN